MGPRQGSIQRGQKRQKGRALTGFAAGQPMAFLWDCPLATAPLMAGGGAVVITSLGESFA
jgi:hypothetical protein